MTGFKCENLLITNFELQLSSQLLETQLYIFITHFMSLMSNKHD